MARQKEKHFRDDEKEISVCLVTPHDFEWGYVVGVYFVVALMLFCLR